MLGSKSGFDTVEECFGDLTSEIFALETGLSSDPPMNWRISNLDRYTLVSNSDAHSPQKLAREATILRCELSYDAIMAALRTGDPEQFGGTLEFFPEEGKYHLDGHRKCGVCWEPPTTIAHKGAAPSVARRSPSASCTASKYWPTAQQASSLPAQPLYQHRAAARSAGRSLWRGASSRRVNRNMKSSWRSSARSCPSCAIAAGGDRRSRGQPPCRSDRPHPPRRDHCPRRL